MFKQTSLIGLSLVLISCGQKENDNSQTVQLDSFAKKTHETLDTSKENAATVKHEAYNEDIKILPLNLNVFVPVNYTALDTTSGDLNLDQYPDMIMVLKKNGEDTTSDVNEHPEKRPLLILIGQADRTYKFAAKSDNAVYCIDCGGIMGDPFMNIVIKKGYFSVEHYGGSTWRWTRTITFKYSPADKYWFLHKDGNESFNAIVPEKVKTKIYTTKDFGKVPFDKFDIYKYKED